MNNVRRSIFTFLGAFFLLSGVFFCSGVFPAQASSGLWGTYNRSPDLNCVFDFILLKWVCDSNTWGTKDEVKELHIENLDFTALFPGDPLNSFGLT